MMPCSPEEILQRLGATVLERGWLSANNTVIRGQLGCNAVVDTGYGAHAAQTLKLVNAALGPSPLHLIINTHLHSDHCGGNALLQQQYPGARTHIPPGHWDAVQQWDTETLTYAPTGQECPQFAADTRLEPGTSIQLGDWLWEVHASPGHDPHSVVFFQRDHRTLISADALWENGFGVVFPELEGEAAFNEVGQTLDVIEALQPQLIIPGHGAIFTDLNKALERARSRLQQFVSDPEKHTRYGLKVLIKYRLLEWRSISVAALFSWVQRTPYLLSHMPPGTDSPERQTWLEQLLSDLQHSGAIRLIDGVVHDH